MWFHLYFLIFFSITRYRNIGAINNAKKSVVYLGNLDKNIINRDCHAVFIKNNLLLTAASCFNHRGDFFIESQSQSQSPKRVNITYRLPHSLFNITSSLRYGIDLGIVKLEEALNMQEYNVEVMPFNPKPIKDNTTCIITNGHAEEMTDICWLLAHFVVMRLYRKLYNRENAKNRWTRGPKHIYVQINSVFGADQGHIHFIGSNDTRLIFVVSEDRCDLAGEQFIKKSDILCLVRVNNDKTQISNCKVLTGAPVLCDGDNLEGITPELDCTKVPAIVYAPALRNQVEWINYAQKDLNDTLARKKSVEDEKRFEEGIKLMTTTTEEVKTDTKTSNAISNSIINVYTFIFDIFMYFVMY